MTTGDFTDSHIDENSFMVTTVKKSNTNTSNNSATKADRDKTDKTSKEQTSSKTGNTGNTGNTQVENVTHSVASTENKTDTENNR